MLTHNELIQKLAQQPGNEQAWSEFVKRFHDYICTIIYRECKRRNYVDDGTEVEDIAQEVYMTLVKNDCDAFKKFEGRFENSIYKYLATTAVRTVLYRISKAGAQKRPPAKKKASLNTPVAGSNYNIPLEEMLSSTEGKESVNNHELREEIDYCLNKMATRRRQGSLYKVIFKYHLYEDFTPQMIKKHIAQRYSLQRIMNIITEVKKDMQKCLQSKEIKKI